MYPSIMGRPYRETNEKGTLIAVSLRRIRSLTLAEPDVNNRRQRVRFVDRVDYAISTAGV
jgi:hypothetical protein